MNKNFSDLYISANAPAVVENIFTGLLWRNRSVSETISIVRDYNREYHYCNVDLFLEKIKEILRAALESEKTFIAFINSRRKGLVSPATKNAADYIKIMWEQEDSLNDVYHFLKKNIAL